MNQTPEERGLNVLYVLDALEFGGVERHVIALSKAVVAAGGTAHVASAGGALVPELARSKARHIVSPMASGSPFTHWRNVLRLSTLVRSQDIDLIHAHMPLSARAASRAARKTGRPFVTTVHHPYRADTLLTRYRNDVIVRGDRVIAVSNFIEDYVDTNFDIASGVLCKIRNGIDFVRFDPASIKVERVTRLTEAWALPDGLPVIMISGRLTRTSGHTEVLDALVHVTGDYVCLMLGVGATRMRMRNHLERQIYERGLSGKVFLIDRCDDMPAAYRLSDVVVAISMQPLGFMRVAIEAQAMGVPVVAANSGGVGESIMDGTAGWIVSPDDPEALGRALDDALSMSADLRVRYAALSRAHVVTHYSDEIMGEQTMKLYAELVGRR